MSLSNGLNPTLSGIRIDDIKLAPTTGVTSANRIPASCDSIALLANITNTSDYIVLPSLADVPNGHRITIIANVANCLLRTPASSGELINAQNCDGTKKYLITAYDVVILTKIDNVVGWMGASWTQLGAKRTAV